MIMNLLTDGLIVVGDITRAVVVCRRADWLKLPDVSQFFTETARDCGRRISLAEAESMEKSGVAMFNDDVARWGKERACHEEETLLTALGPAQTKQRLLDDFGREALAAIADLGHHRWLRLKPMNGKRPRDVTMPIRSLTTQTTSTMANRRRFIAAHG